MGIFNKGAMAMAMTLPYPGTGYCSTDTLDLIT